MSSHFDMIRFGFHVHYRKSLDCNNMMAGSTLLNFTTEDRIEWEDLKVMLTQNLISKNYWVPFSKVHVVQSFKLPSTEPMRITDFISFL